MKPFFTLSLGLLGRVFLLFPTWWRRRRTEASIPWIYADDDKHQRQQGASVSTHITNNIESVGERVGDQEHSVIKLVDSSKKNDPDLFELQLNKQKM